MILLVKINGCFFFVFLLELGYGHISLTTSDTPARGG